MCSYSKSRFHHTRCISVCAKPFWKKKLATLLSNQRDFFFGCSCSSFLFILQMVEAQADPAPLLSVSFTLSILPSKHCLPHKHTSPGHEARKVKTEILESPHQRINKLAFPQRTNPLSEKGILILWQTWRKKNSHLFSSFVTLRLILGWSREMQHPGGPSCTCKISPIIYSKKFAFLTPMWYSLINIYIVL